jgi:hypothetical protein
MPVTSSTGEPAGGCVDALAGQRTLPRISLATCSALAAPAGAALVACAPPVLGVLVLLDPQAASQKRATAYVMHAKRFMMSLPTNEKVQLRNLLACLTTWTLQRWGGRILGFFDLLLLLLIGHVLREGQLMDKGSHSVAVFAHRHAKGVDKTVRLSGYICFDVHAGPAGVFQVTIRQYANWATNKGRVTRTSPR